MDDDQDSDEEVIAFIVMMISYGIAFFTSIIWISYFPNVYHGFRALKAEVLIGGIFQLAWMLSNFFCFVRP